MTDAFHVATRKGLFRYERRNGGWQAGAPAFLGEPVSAVLTDPRDGAIYAALRLGHFGQKLHRSRDGGTSWEELEAPKFGAEPPPPSPANAENFEADMAARKAAQTVDTIWIMTAGGADQPGVLWAGTLPGALFKSKDHGESWSLVESLWNVPERAKWFGGGADLPGIHSVHVDPRDSAKLTVGVSCGGVWKSDDGGETWRQAGQGLRAAFLPPEMQYDPVSQDPHRLAHSGDTVWCQHHNGVFLSRDGGESFTEIEEAGPSVFGFAVATHPDDPESAWLVPGVKDETRVPVDGKFVVTRTRDGGKSFEALSNGLPDGPAWDLVYRHALDIDGTGERLVMGSTTGNCWLTEDGGDSWICVSTYLPPIAAVAWA